MPALRTLALPALAIWAVFAGCQGILGIQDPTLRQGNAGGASGAGGSFSGGGHGGDGAIDGGNGAGGEGEDRITYRWASDVIIGMVVGSDQNFWLSVGDALLRVSPRWEVTKFPVPEGFSTEGLTLGSDGNVWYGKGDTIGRITPSGGIEEYALPKAALPADDPIARVLGSGPDGQIWFIGHRTLGKISTAGKVTVFDSAPEGYLWGITAGDDGNMWVTAEQQNEIVTVGLDGAILDSWLIPRAEMSLSTIVRGPDKNLWFLEPVANRLGKIAPTGAERGTITEYLLPAGAIPGDLVAGPDGALWVALYETRQLARVTTEGEIEVYPIPSDWRNPGNLVVGPDGALWFTANGNLARFDL